MTSLTREIEDALALFVIPQKTDLTGATFFTYVLPPFGCQYLMGVLVQLEGTRIYRLALLPILLWFTWRATFVDMSGGDVKKVQWNSMYVTQLCLMSTRPGVWAFSRVRYQRLRDGPASVHPSEESNPYDFQTICAACWNTFDLMINSRGVGWNWGGRIIPKSAPDVDSRVVMFVLSSAAAVVFHALAFDACVQCIRSLSPDTFGSSQGGPLLPGSSAPMLEYGRAVLVSALAGVSPYFGLQYAYNLFAIVGVTIFRQPPSHWPPLFDAPWRATSLGELWGRRFHQLLRDTVLVLGAQPVMYVFGTGEGGRLAGVLGAFFVSGIIHDIELRSSGRSCNAFIIVGFWVMNGVGVVLERLWKRVTGRTVGGVWGQVWVVGWLALWGIPTVNEYAMVGRFAALSLPGGFAPSLAVIAFVPWRF